MRTRIRGLLRAANLVLVNGAVLVGLLVLLEGAAWLAIAVKARVAPGDTAPLPPRYRQEAHAGHQDWLPGYLADRVGVRFRYRVGLFEPGDYRSPTLNVEDGVRRSSDGPLPGGPPPETVFVLGGSTVWGSGVKDEYTIPSHLNRLAGGGYRFVNHGVPADQTTQESLRLGLLLAEGKAPDVAVFYDGANDIRYALLEGPGLEMSHALNEEKLRGSLPSLLRELVRDTHAVRVIDSLATRLHRRQERAAPDYEVTPADRALVDRAAAIYLGNHRYARRLGEAFGFQVLTFLQPLLSTGQEVEAGVVTAFERSEYEKADRRTRALVRLFHAAVRASGEPIDLSRVFVESGTPGNYYDRVHLGPRGNAIVAERIYRALGAGRPRPSPAPGPG